MALGDLMHADPDQMNTSSSRFCGDISSNLPDAPDVEITTGILDEAGSHIGSKPLKSNVKRVFQLCEVLNPLVRNLTNEDKIEFTLM